MNLSKLFDMQRELDVKIIREKGLEGQDLLPGKILALQVEIGECANEWRGFKFWSKNQQPRTKAVRNNAINEEDKQYFNPLLEEYVDCLHFILSIGLERFAHESVSPREWAFYKYPAKERHWLEMIEHVSLLNHTDNLEQYWFTFYLFRQLGHSLGFTWEQIEQAYYSKNEVNHQRQATGY